ncbi:MAG: Glutamine--scyllo-inositol transaminase [Cyanobacteria bacterium RYN_339]|nr:Glutamine--scyllo-inositol transaminase [Cyanobacteria bacterium RYN_339]
MNQADRPSPVRTAPLPPWPTFAPDEIAAVTAVLQSGKVNYWTGNEGRLFEQEYAASLGMPHAIALANGTVALELALYVLDIGPGDDVVTTCRTFIASASAAVMRGARPIMADVDRDSQNVTAETIAAALTPATKALIVVHLAGWPCDMDPILALARERGLYVIEDCAQAHGATYKGRPVGTLGDIGAFSFCQDKILTTGGEGGLIVMHDERLWKKAWAFKDHGKSYDAVYHREHAPGFRWLHESFGTNMRLTEIQSAIGRVQLRKLPEWVATRRRHAAQLIEAFSRLPALRVPVVAGDSEHAYYKFYAFVRPERLRVGWDRDRILQAIVAEGVPCFSGSCSEIYLEQAFPAELRPPERLPVAKELGETSLLFLVHPTMTTADITDTCQAVERVLALATGA